MEAKHLLLSYHFIIYSYDLMIHILSLNGIFFSMFRCNRKTHTTPRFPLLPFPLTLLLKTLSKA